LPAANRLSFVFITRPTSLCLDLPRLLPTIRAEMDYIEEHDCKYNLVNALPFAQSIPGLMGIALRTPVCLSTAILTNLGDTVRRLRFRFPGDNGRPVIGNLQFVRARAAPPLRPKTGLGIGLTISLGEFFIQGQFDSRIFSQTDASDFMQLFEDRWRNWASSKEPFAAG
jgi:hypothetical protein